MLKYIFRAAVVAALAAGTAPASAQSARSAKTLYADAMAKEQAVRTALADADASETVLKAVRTVVRDYENVVRRYPTSGYCDDALWYGAQLSLEAFAKFGEAREQDAAVRLLRALASEYPSSKFAKEVPALVASASTAAPSAPRSAASDTPAPRTPSEPRALATIREIRRTVIPDGVRVTIELDREVPFHDERLDDPLRVFVDLAATKAAPALIDRTIRFEEQADLVRQIRVGRHANNVTRVVLDADGLGSYSVYPMYAPFRLVIDALRPSAASAPVPTLGEGRVPEPVGERPADALEAETVAEDPAPAAPAAVKSAPAAPARALPATATTAASPPPVPVTAPPSRNLAGGFSVARQLGLGVSRIVIDPGHGGQDPGAIGKGVSEADLVLDVALRLEKLLQAVPGVEVILTRRADDYVALQDRTALANREGADLFLSIHANASNNTQARGVETYFLNFTTNQGAAAVAARENAASGQAMGALGDLLKRIALDSKRDESRDFATYVQKAMIQQLKPANRSVRDLGVKEAPFMVLVGASMPSVLAEISFVTNTQEAKLLRTANYRQRIADALFDAIRKYQTSLKTESKVAQQ